MICLGKNISPCRWNLMLSAFLLFSDVLMPSRQGGHERRFPDEDEGSVRKHEGGKT